MKIVLFANSFLPTHGGREMVVHHLASSFAKLGHEPRVVLIGGARSRKNINVPYPVHIYPAIGSFLGLQKRYLWYYYDLKKFGADIINAHATYPSGFTAVRLSKRFKVPVIITPHGNDIHMIPEIKHGLRLNEKYNRKICFAIQNANLVTSISQSITDSILDAGCTESYIRTIPNGIDIDRFEANQSLNVYDWLKISPTSKILLSVGRYQPRKGQDYIIKSMPAILKEQPETKLVIVGIETEALMPLIEKLSLQKHVILTGQLKFPGISGTNNQIDYLAALYLASHIYISGGISEGAEGLSLAVLDAMASGVPIIATDISGNRDVVKDGKTGYLVKPKDELDIAEKCLKVLNNPDDAKYMSDNVREYARHNSWVAIAERYIDVYEEAINSF